MGKFARSCRRELGLTNCGFDHDPAESMIRSQWQSKSECTIYLLYRWLMAIYVVFVVAMGMTSHAKKYTFSLFFIYLTNWGILLNMIVGVFGAVLVTMWYFNVAFKSNLQNL